MEKNFLAICGSLRALSYNKVALEAMARLAPVDIEVNLFGDMAALPLFNPDLDQAGLAPVEALRAAVRAADGLIIASPEYAHGITGVMKNALDWLVSMEDFPGKPVALVNTSPRAGIAQESLREILRTMSAQLVQEADVTLPLQGSQLGLEGVLAQPALCALLRGSLEALAVQCRLPDPETSSL